MGADDYTLYLRRYEINSVCEEITFSTLNVTVDEIYMGEILH